MLLKSKLLELRQLMSSFFRVGLFTFGGGYAMLTLLEDEVVTKRNWIDHEQMLDLYAIGQSTPGVIMVNVATFIGYQRAGIVGGIIATGAVALPSIIIVSLLALFFTEFSDNIWVQKAMKGVNLAVAVLLCSAVITLWKRTVKTPYAKILMALSFFLVQFFGISTVILIPSMVILGLIRSKWSRP